jgi:hypothetical protein
VPADSPLGLTVTLRVVVAGAAGAVPAEAEICSHEPPAGVVTEDSALNASGCPALWIEMLLAGGRGGTPSWYENTSEAGLITRDVEGVEADDPPGVTLSVTPICCVFWDAPVIAIVPV